MMCQASGSISKLTAGMPHAAGGWVFCLPVDAGGSMSLHAHTHTHAHTRTRARTHIHTHSATWCKRERASGGEGNTNRGRGKQRDGGQAPEPRCRSSGRLPGALPAPSALSKRSTCASRQLRSFQAAPSRMRVTRGTAPQHTHGRQAARPYAGARLLLSHKAAIW